MDDANQNQSGQPQAAGDKQVKLGKYTVKVVRDLCIGAASCVAVSPAAFQLDGENKAVIPDGAADADENVLLAAQSCPTKAIIVIETDTGRQVWPA